MFLGTHSDAGKSLMAAAFCRILARKGYRVAPFKAQNMSNNAGVTPEGGEMGRAQFVQAEAAGIAAHTDMNPVLLKPERGQRSQIVLNGQVHGYMEAGNWVKIKPLLWDEVRAAYDRLSRRYDVVILEGAGSPAEINLKEGDIVNLRMARHAQAPAILVGDIDRGGVFAALAGTMLLLEPEERAQIRGFLINKFRGDPALLGDGLEMLREKAFGVETLGVVPFLPGLRIADEDAVALDHLSPDREETEVDIAVIQLPHISNFDDFNPLRAEPGVQVRYVQRREELGKPQVVILPGTKSTLADLEWLRKQGLDEVIVRAQEMGIEVVGICGGYQLLGDRLSDPEGVEGLQVSAALGLGLLPVDTRFCAGKQTHQARLRLPDGEELRGYEIHTGQTTLGEGAAPLGEIVERSGEAVQVVDGAQSVDGRVWGTYLHGLFDNDGFRKRWLQKLGWGGSGSLSREVVEAEYERLADAVEEAVNLPAIMRIMGLE